MQLKTTANFLGSILAAEISRFVNDRGHMELQTTHIAQEIRTYLTEGFLFGSSEALNENTPLLGNVIDSQGMIELVAFLQQRFNIEVGDEEVTTDNLATLKTVVALVERKLPSKT